MKKWMILCSAMLVWSCGDLESKPDRLPANATANNSTANNSTSNNSTSANSGVNNATTNNSVTTVEFGLSWSPQQVTFADLGPGQLQEATITFTNDSSETIAIKAAGTEEFDDDGTTEFYFKDEVSLPPSELAPGDTGQAVIVYEPANEQNDGGLFYFEWEEGAFQRTGEIELSLEAQ